MLPTAFVLGKTVVPMIQVFVGGVLQNVSLTVVCVRAENLGRIFEILL
jgi:hypothetical protein